MSEINPSVRYKVVVKGQPNQQVGTLFDGRYYVEDNESGDLRGKELWLKGDLFNDPLYHAGNVDGLTIHRLDGKADFELIPE